MAVVEELIAKFGVQRGVAYPLKSSRVLGGVDLSVCLWEESVSQLEVVQIDQRVVEDVERWEEDSNGVLEDLRQPDEIKLCEGHV